MHIDSISGCGMGGGGGGGCGGGCRTRYKRNADGGPILTKTITGESDNRCNSQRINSIIAENLQDNIISSKTAIHNVLNEEIGGINVVLCTNDQQSQLQFSVDSDEHCSGSGHNFKCYAFHME